MTDGGALAADPLAGAGLRALRLARGLSAAHLASRLSVSRSSVHRWERGVRLPGPLHLTGLAEALAVPLTDVVRFFDDHRPPPERATGLPGGGLRALRRARGLTAPRLAASLGVPPHTIYNWERGGARVPGERLPALASALGLTEHRLQELLRRAQVVASVPAPAHPVAALRIRAGLTQVAAADRLGVARSTLRQWERGARPPLAALRGMARLYDVPVAEVAARAGVRCPAQLDPASWTRGDLPAVLRVLRTWSGLTQRALADHVGASADTVRGWENGRIQPGPRLRRALEGAYRLPDGALLAAYS